MKACVWMQACPCGVRVSLCVCVCVCVPMHRYCHPPLPFYLYGGALAYSPHLNVLILIGGSSKFYLAASDTMYVLNLTALPPPQPCLYKTAFNRQWWRQPSTIVRAAHQWPYNRKFLSVKDSKEL